MRQQPRPPAQFADTPRQAREFMDELYREAYLEGRVTALDTEFVPVTHEPVLMSYSWGRGVRRVVRAELVAEFFGDWLADEQSRIAYQNYKEDAETLGMLGLSEADLARSFYVDVMITGVLRDETLVKHGLKAQMHHFLKWFRREYAQLFCYVPSGKKKPIVMDPRQVMDDLPPDALTGAVLGWGGAKGGHKIGARDADAWRRVMIDYAGDDAEGTQLLAVDHRRYLRKTEYWDKYEKVDREFTLTLMQCEDAGALVDKPILRKILRKQEIRIMRAEHCFRAAAGDPKLNLRSGPQMKKLLIDEWGWPEHPTIQTDSGGVSMDKEVLNWWLSEHKLEMARVKLAFNNASTMKGTFLEGILTGVSDDGRLRSDLNQIGAKVSGRISSRKFDVLVERSRTLKSGELKTWVEKKKAGANLQNIPARKEKDPDGIRGAFRAPRVGEVTAWGDRATESHKLLVADYSGFHLMLVIHFVSKLTRKSAMLDIMKKYGTPSAVHVYTTIQMFKHVPPHRCSDRCRDPKTGEWKKLHGENKTYSLKEFTMDDWKLVKPIFPDQYTYSKNCVTGETMILTERGYRRIDELCAGAPVGRSKPAAPIRIMSRDGLREVSDVYRGGRQSVKRVTTELGLAVRANDTHDMPVVRGGKIEMVKVGDLNVGDLCVLKFGSDAHGCSTVVPLMAQGGATSYKPIDLPVVLTPEVARLLGYYIAEGYSVKSNTTYYTSFGFGPEDGDMVLDVERCLRAVAGSRVRIADDDGGVRRLYVTSKDLYEWWQFLGCGESFADKQIPPCILAAPWNIKREFLRAYFAGDGSIHNRAVKATSKSELLIRQLQGELINVGIACSVFSGEVSDYGVYWSVQVASSRYVKKFAELVGFSCSRKQRLADEVGKRDVGDHSTLRLEGFEHEHEILRARTHGDLRGRVSQVIRGTCRLGETVVRRLEQLDAFAGTAMDGMLDDGLWTVRVTSIEPDGEEEVFDLYEPVHKVMVASGLLVGDTNFALIFLGSPWTLAYNTGRDANDPDQLDECKRHYDDWYDLYPEIPIYQRHMVDHAYEHGWVPTIGGRRGHLRKMLEGCDRNGKYIDDEEKRKKLIKHAERVATNTPAQGCLHEGTLVLTAEEGIRPICELSELSGRSDLSVWDGVRWSPAGVAPSGKKRELVVRFHGGLEVRCSPDHRFLASDNVGKRSWKTPAQFGAQQYVVLSDCAGEWHAAHASAWRTVRSRAHNANDMSILELRGFDRGLFLGRVASDGWVRDGASVRLMVAEHEKGILPRLRELCAKIGKTAEYRRDRSHEDRQPMYYLELNSAALTRQLGSLKGYVPSQVMADSGVLRGYLCGLFDGDGTVNRDGAKLTFGGGHRYLAWAEQVQQALFFLGVRSRITTGQESRVDLSVQKADTRRFAERVGFLNRIKQRKLEAIVPGHAEEPSYGRVLRVQSVTDTGRMVEMYDVIDSSTSQFAAAGVVTHNSEADIVKMAMNLIRKSEKMRSLRAAPLFPVHDEIVVEAPASTSKPGLEEQIRLMKQPYREEMEFELAVEGATGDNWIDAKP